MTVYICTVSSHVMVTPSFVMMLNACPVLGDPAFHALMLNDRLIKVRQMCMQLTDVGTLEWPLLGLQ